jgi:endonuclease/exonuclease/phosphatase family metal-dependent hydrolase
MPLRLVTWNVQWCCGVDGRVDPQRIVATARALADFDVLCLQEVADGYPALRGDAGDDQPARLAQSLPGFVAIFGPAVDETGADGRRSRFGNLVLTRLPVREQWQQRLPWPARPGRPSMPRSCSVVVVDAPGLGPLRIMTTHLEYFDGVQRLAQAKALREMHREACAQAEHPPALSGDERGTPFQPRAHTTRAVLCGDFNAPADGPEHAAITEPFATSGGQRRFVDAWEVVSPAAAQPATFRCFDKTYGPTPVACDFVFVSDDLAGRVAAVRIDGRTRASDHQPVLLELA